MRNRIIYLRRNHPATTYDAQILADFQARGWVVDDRRLDYYGDAPAASSIDWADVHRVVVGPYGSNGDSSGYYYQIGNLSEYRAPIVVMDRYTLSSGPLGLGTTAYGTSVSSFTRTATAPNPPAAWASATASAKMSVYSSPASGATHHYYTNAGATTIGVASRQRTVGADTYEDVFFGYHWPASMSANMLALWHAYSGGSELSPRAVRAHLSSPLGAMQALGWADTAVRVSLPPPLAQVAAHGALRAKARISISGPLPGWVRPLVAVQTLARARVPSPLWPVAAIGVCAPAVQARLRAPLAVLRALVGVGVDARASVRSPLGVLRARGVLPRVLPPEVVPPSQSASETGVSARVRTLSEPLPLRRTTDLPAYRTEAVLPWVYGRVTLTPLPWDTAGLQWLVADHPVLAVTAVRDGGRPVTGWDLVQQADATGHAVAILRLAAAPEGQLSVSMAGRRHAVTGALVEHPADIAADLCARCGLAAGDWSALRAHWPAVALGAVIDEAMSLRDALARLMATVGARWSGSPLRAWMPGDGAIVAALGAQEIDDATAASEATALATRLTVPWGWDWAAGEPRGAVVVHAPEARERYGDLPAELPAPWLRTARDATALAHAELARRGRAQWTMEAQTGPGEAYRPGDRVDVTHPWLPSGAAEISRVAVSSAGQRLTLTRPAGPQPRVETLRRGALLDPDAADPLRVTYRDGVASFTIQTDAGEPLRGAAVQLDGGTTHYTDRLGRVQIRTARGDHTLTVVAEGYATMELEVTV